MAKKPASRAEFVRFDVFYKDGSQRSNRKVPKPALAGIDDDEDRKIEKTADFCGRSGLRRVNAVEKPHRAFDDAKIRSLHASTEGAAQFVLRHHEEV